MSGKKTSLLRSVGAYLIVGIFLCIFGLPLLLMGKSVDEYFDFMIPHLLVLAIYCLLVIFYERVLKK